jgi:hypothetical protein
MPEDFLRLATTFSRDFRELESMAEQIAVRVNADDATSIEEAVLEGAKFIETRCAQGGTTMIFQPSKSTLDRERLSDALGHLVRRKIAGKRGSPGN